MRPPVADLPETATRVAWQGRLNEAATGDEVAAVAREFLAQLGGEVLAQLPQDVRPGTVSNAKNVVYYALKLAHTEIGDARSAPVLHGLSTFFTKAALRIVQIDERRSEVQRETGSGT